MEWSTTRRLLYGILILLTVGLLSVYPIYFFTHKEPTCFDAKQNGNEVGVDCGGVCALYCPVQIEQLKVVWAKAFPVTAGRYDVGAYVENSNRTAGIKSLRYTLRVVDREGKELGIREGATEIAPGATALLFEGDVAFEKEPGEVKVEFNTEDLAWWLKAKAGPADVVIKNQSLKNTSQKPRFDAVLLNTDLVNDAAPLIVGAIVYDLNRQPVAISRTFAEGIPKGGSQNIFFTWPNAFTGGVEGSFLTDIIITPKAIFE